MQRFCKDHIYHTLFILLIRPFKSSRCQTGDPKSKYLLFLGKSPEDDAPNENHRQIRPNGQQNMDLYSFGRAGREHKYKIEGMSGNEHICVIGFAPASQTHKDMTSMIESLLENPFAIMGSKTRNRFHP